VPFLPFARLGLLTEEKHVLVETKLDSKMLALWSECVNHPILSGHLVGTTQRSRVYQLRGESQSYIVKLTQDMDSIRREELVNQYLDSEEFLQSHRPKMVYFGEIQNEFCIAFSDDRLRDVRKGAYFENKAMELLANLHKMNSRGLPSVCCSHTPPFQEIATVACTLDISRLKDDMRILGIGKGARKKVLKLYHSLQFINLIKLQTERTLCHGDAHIGNFMWSYKQKSWFLIDWEYAHMNHPYFDLFQFLDATSPYKPRQNRATRKAVLSLYRQKNTGFCNGQNDTSSWFRGYYQYAACHLFWIVQRIWHDFEQKRFRAEQLSRQLTETYQRLASIEHDLESI
jgi:thiamine kinase-like enzyme